MIIEFWWKVFILAAVTAGISKLFGCPVGFVGVFFFASLGWFLLFLLALAVSHWRGK